MATARKKKFVLQGGYSNIDGWHSKMILINRANKDNNVLMKFYSDTDGKVLILKKKETLKPFEIRGIELNFEELKDHFGKIDLKSDDMLDGSVATMKGNDSIIDFRLSRPDVICC